MYMFQFAALTTRRQTMKKKTYRAAYSQKLPCSARLELILRVQDS